MMKPNKESRLWRSANLSAWLSGVSGASYALSKYLEANATTIGLSDQFVAIIGVIPPTLALVAATFAFKAKRYREEDFDENSERLNDAA